MNYRVAQCSRSCGYVEAFTCKRYAPFRKLSGCDRSWFARDEIQALL